MGRIDVHAHLLSGVDDGCQTLDESLACARRLVEVGYSHVFCTPHVWSNLPHNNPTQITARTAQLQSAFDSAGIPLRLLSGGEINLVSQLQDCVPSQIVTYSMAGRWVLVDLWADRIPDFFEPTIRRLQSHGLSVILAHPERMRAVQDDPALADWFAELGVRLQGNFQCFSDRPDAHTRRTAERFFEEDRYFLLGTDLHGWESLPARLAGMQRVREIDPRKFDRLTIDNPRLLLPTS